MNRRVWKNKRAQERYANRTPEEVARRREYMARYYQEHRAEILQRNKASYALTKDAKLAQAKAMYRTDYVRVILRRAQVRAKQQGREFNIDRSDIHIPTHCPILGLKLERSHNGRGTAQSPSRDRIDSTKGYVKGNVWIISRKANSMKHDATPDELVRFAHWALKFAKEVK